MKFKKRPCRSCGQRITTNALGRASHERSCKGPELERAAAEDRARKRAGTRNLIR